jgi:hypothetical protein
MLMNGLKESPSIMGDVNLHSRVLGAILQSAPNIRYAGVKVVRGKPASVLVAWRSLAESE